MSGDLDWRGVLHQQGLELKPLQLPPLSRTTLALFAGGSGDHNPLHIDTDFARQVAGMDDVIGHGMLTMAYLGRYATLLAPQAQLRALKARFVAMSTVRDVITCRGTVGQLTTIAGEERVAVDLTAARADGAVLAAGQAIFAL